MPGHPTRLSAVAPLRPSGKRPRAYSESDSQTQIVLHPSTRVHTDVQTRAHTARDAPYRTSRPAYASVKHSVPMSDPSDMELDEGFPGAIKQQKSTDSADSVPGGIALSKLAESTKLQIGTANAETRSPLLSDLAKPLVDELESVCLGDCNDVIQAHQSDFDSMLRQLGDLVENQSVTLLDEIEPHIKSFLGYNAACATAVVDETDAAVAVMAELLQEQKILLKRLDENYARTASRNEKLIPTMDAIRAVSNAALGGCDEEYNQATVDIERKVKALKLDKDIQSDFNKYMMQHMGGGGRR